jgi:serine/threonine-protein kinase
MIGPGEDPVALARLVDAVCDRFEADWRAGLNPRLESYLVAVPPGERSAALCELLALEVELRRRAGEQPTEAEYSERFPAEADSVAAAFRESAAPPGAPAAFEHYDLLRPLGRGGMGVVYKARDRRLNREVALKVLRVPVGDPSGRGPARFLREAEATARLDHPNIVPIYEAGEAGEVLYYAMPYVEGRNLAEWLREGPLPPRRAAELMEPVARAVHYAHSRGILHRDLKPRNILIDADGLPRVADFGLAKPLHEPGGTVLTMAGAVLGTPSYMSPEQVKDAGRVTVAGDVYGLGATLYALVTGRPPFQAATVMDTLRQVIDEEVVSPRRLNPSLDRDLETIALKCLHKDPARRYPTAEALADDLRRYLQGQPIAARPVGPVERAWRWCRQNRLAAALAVALLLALLGWVVSVAVLVRLE